MGEESLRLLPQNVFFILGEVGRGFPSSPSIVKAGKERNMNLSVGMTAPDFELPSHLGHKVRLSDLRGKNVVLAFYPLAWTPI